MHTMYAYESTRSTSYIMMMHVTCSMHTYYASYEPLVNHVLEYVEYRTLS